MTSLLVAALTLMNAASVDKAAPPSGYAMMPSWPRATRAFISTPTRVLSPPCEGGVRGGGPRGTSAWCAVPRRLDRVERPSRPKRLVMPCPPPLTQAFARGDMTSLVPDAHHAHHSPKRLDAARPPLTQRTLPSSPPIGEESSQRGEKDRLFVAAFHHVQQKRASESEADTAAASATKRSPTQQSARPSPGGTPGWRLSVV